jgi:hypothetical protein
MPLEAASGRSAPVVFAHAVPDEGSTHVVLQSSALAFRPAIET